MDVGWMIRGLIELGRGGRRLRRREFSIWSADLERACYKV